MKQIKNIIPAAGKRKLKTIINHPNELVYWLGFKSIYKSENYKKIEALKNCHKGKRCFIIGSGPSINKMNLSVLKNEITFGHNAFYLIADKVDFYPTYNVIEDPFPAEDNAKEINSLKNTQNIVAHDLRYCLNNKDTIYTFFDRSYENCDSINFPKFSFDCARKTYWGGTVVYLSIQLAAYMGCKQIYLLGIDLSYKVPNYMENDVITSQAEDVNHFHPDYFGKGKRWHDPKVDRMQKSIEYAYKILSEEGCNLYNAGIGGNLINVPRIDFDELI